MSRAGPDLLPRPARSASNQEVRQGSCEWLCHSRDAGKRVRASSPAPKRNTIRKDGVFFLEESCCTNAPRCSVGADDPVRPPRPQARPSKASLCEGGGAKRRRERKNETGGAEPRPYTPPDTPRERPVPLPLGEVAERSEGGEGKQRRTASRRSFFYTLSAVQHFSNTTAVPIPPPMHRVARPFLASGRFCISCSRVTMIRAPDAPTG